MLPRLTEKRWRDIAAGFELNANFPNCIGAIDGKHVRITCPTDSGSLYFDHKEYFSLVLLAIADSNNRFVYIDLGSYGKVSGYAIYQNSD